MIKHINGWDLAKKMKGNCKVYLKPFSRAKKDCMIHYSKPSVRHDLDHFILHIDTTDLKPEKSPEFLTECIIDLAVSLKNEKRDVSISNSPVRTQNQELSKKDNGGKQMSARVL